MVWWENSSGRGWQRRSVYAGEMSDNIGQGKASGWMGQ